MSRPADGAILFDRKISSLLPPFFFFFVFFGSLILLVEKSLKFGPQVEDCWLFSLARSIAAATQVIFAALLIRIQTAGGKRFRRGSHSTYYVVQELDSISEADLAVIVHIS